MTHNDRVSENWLLQENTVSSSGASVLCLCVVSHLFKLGLQFIISMDSPRPYQMSGWKICVPWNGFDRNVHVGNSAGKLKLVFDVVVIDVLVLLLFMLLFVILCVLLLLLILFLMLFLLWLLFDFSVTASGVFLGAYAEVML